jgi:hypothetical protein
MSQSSSIRELPKDNLRNNEEARIVQSIINDNVEELNPSMGRQQQQEDYDPRYYDQEYGQQGGQQQQMMMPEYDPNPQQFMQQPQMPRQMPQQQQMMMPPMSQQQIYNMQQQQVQAQQAAQQAVQAIGVPKELVENKSLLNWLWFEAKEPLIVAAIYFVISMNFVKMLFANYIPYMSNSFINLLFRAIVTGILVYVSRKLV